MSAAWAILLKIRRQWMVVSRDPVKWKGKRYERNQKKVSRRRTAAEPGPVHLRRRLDCRFTLYLDHGDGAGRLGEPLSRAGGRGAPLASRALHPGAAGLAVACTTRGARTGCRSAQSI